jgi:hypothetical protein
MTAKRPSLLALTLRLAAKRYAILRQWRSGSPDGRGTRCCLTEVMPQNGGPVKGDRPKSLLASSH